MKEKLKEDRARESGASHAWCTPSRLSLTDITALANVYTVDHDANLLAMYRAQRAERAARKKELRELLQMLPGDEDARNELIAILRSPAIPVPVVGQK